MTYIGVNPKTGMPKEYPSSAEFFKEVEEIRGEPQKPPREVKTFADASLRLREQIGLDLRDPSEIKEADDRGYIKEQIAEGVAEAMEKQREAQFVDGQFSQTPKPTMQAHSASGPRYKFYDGQKGCTCKAASQKPAGQTVIHSGRGVGPTMSAQLVTRPEVVRNGTAYQLYHIRRPLVP